MNIEKKDKARVMPTTLLLGSYYKYGTYKCYRPDFLDRTVRIFET